MTVSTPASSDRDDLRHAVKKSNRKARIRALLFAAPLLLFLLLNFAWPVMVILMTSWRNVEPPQLLPSFYQALAVQNWQAGEQAGESTASLANMPDETVMAALAADLAKALSDRTLGQLARRLNYELPSIRSKITEAAKMADAVINPQADQAANPKPSTWRERFLTLDPVWGDSATWSVLVRNQSPVTWYYSLTAIDMRQNATGAIIRAEPDQAIYLRILGRTLWIASLVTVITLLLGFPVAYVLTVVPPNWGRFLMLLVLLPLWTSLLVRTTAWVVLLQSEGVINAILLQTGLVAERVQMIFTRMGTITAMTHIQLPFTLLPIYSVMRTISGAQLRAARSLGAPPLVAWWRIYAPQTLPGVVAGGLMTFILSLAYYITPALVGGPNDQMMSNFIATFINRDLNWGLAAALSTVLLVVILSLYWIFLRLVGWERIRLG